MKANKKTVLSTAAVLGVAALLAGGTIAYFTDNDSAENRFTVGNVDITLYESQLHRVNSNMGSSSRHGTPASDASADNYHYCLPYHDNSTNKDVFVSYCTPNIAVTTDYDGVSAWQNGHVRAQNVTTQAGVFDDDTIIADSESTDEATATTPGGYADYAADEYQNLVAGKEVRKFVYVKNGDKNSAYVRVKVTIPAEVADIVTVKVPHTPLEESTTAGNNNINDQAMNYAYITSDADRNPTNPKSSSSWDKQADGSIVMTFVYTDALKPNEMTYWSPITAVLINKDLTESDIAALSTKTLEYLRTTGFGITVDVDAIQSEGFTSAADAFAEFDNKTVGTGDDYDAEINI